MSDATSARSYRPGSWFGIFGDHVTVVLPPSEKARVAQLWELVDEGAGFDEVLDALISGGLRELPGFVLVSAFETDTKVVVRGPARATFTTSDGPVELAGSSATTWVERSMTGVTGMAIDVSEEGAEGGEATGPDHTVDNGLVRVSRVDDPPYTAEVAALPDEVADVPDETADVPDETAKTPIQVPEPPAEPDLPPTQATPMPPPPTHAATVPPPPITPEPPAADHDGLTRAGVGEPEPFVPPPGIPGQPPAPSVVSRPVAKLVFSSGETVEVDRAVLVGRAPEARRFPSSEQPRLVTVPSPQQEISSTHLELRPGSGADHGSAVVTDLGSTNGTVLVQPGLPPEDLQPGIAVQLIPGAIIDLGDGVTIQVINP